YDATDYEQLLARFAADERALTWRERLRQALKDLAAGAQQLPAWVLERLGGAAEAAVEVALDQAAGVGRVLFDPALEVVTGGGVRFTPGVTVRTRGPAGNEVTGVVQSDNLPRAWVTVNTRAGTVRV